MANVGEMKVNKKYLIGVLLCLILGLFGCTTEEEPQPTDSQLSCEHEYVEIDIYYDRGERDIVNTVYCPKCKFETDINSKEWRKIQADMDYENNNKEEYR